MSKPQNEMSTPHPGEATLEPKTCAYCDIKIKGMPFRAWFGFVDVHGVPFFGVRLDDLGLLDAMLATAKNPSGRKHII